MNHVAVSQMTSGVPTALCVCSRSVDRRGPAPSVVCASPCARLQIRRKTVPPATQLDGAPSLQGLPQLCFAGLQSVGIGTLFTPTGFCP